MKTALIIVDVQYDFCKNGALAVPDGDSVIPYINTIVREYDYDEIILSQDYHPADHISFAINNEGKSIGESIELPNGTQQIMWPAHCVQGTKGAEFHHDLIKPKNYKVIQKGKNKMVDSYSAFYDNNHEVSTGLKDYLLNRAITHVEIAGLAQDYCVKFTALDAMKIGFQTTLHYRGTKPVNMKPHDGDNTLLELVHQGISIIA